MEYFFWRNIGVAGLLLNRIMALNKQEYLSLKFSLFAYTIFNPEERIK